MKISTDHPSLSTATPNQLSKLYLNNQIEQVDFIFTYSSIEHDGLGR